MSGQRNRTTDHAGTPVYQIRVEGHLDRAWGAWFAGLVVTLEDDGHTILAGPVVDQAALHGLLKKVRDLGMPLVSVSRIEPSQVPQPTRNGE